MTARSALLIAVPAAEPLVGSWRARYDEVAGRGVPAHVTLLYPFRPAAALYDAVIAAVQAVCREHEPFEFTLARVERFDDQVVFLAPEPAQPFRALTGALTARFPDCPPYGGQIVDPLPHLTVADVAHALVHAEVWEEFRAAAEERLPIVTRADHVALYVQDRDGRWHERAQIPLGGEPG